MNTTEKMFGKDFTTPDELFEAVGKQVRTMPQIIIDDKHIGGYNELVEYFSDKGLCNYKGEKDIMAKLNMFILLLML